MKQYLIPRLEKNAVEAKVEKKCNRSLLVSSLAIAFLLKRNDVHLKKEDFVNIFESLVLSVDDTDQKECSVYNELVDSFGKDNCKYVFSMFASCIQKIILIAGQ